MTSVKIVKIVSFNLIIWLNGGEQLTSFFATGYSFKMSPSENKPLSVMIRPLTNVVFQ